MRKGHVILLIVLLAALAGAVFGGLKVMGIYKEYQNNITTEGTDVIVTIEKGANVKKIAQTLKEKGLIDSTYAFILKVKDKNLASSLKYGEFKLNTGMCISDMLLAMTESAEDQEAIKLVIPEGYSVEMIANRVEKMGLCTAEEFLEAVQETDYSYEFLSDIPEVEGVKYKLQGFLFPATYQFNKTATAHDIVDRMLKAFEDHYSQADANAAQKDGRSMYDIITIASIVEREAKLQEERPIIAGVVYNRLDIDMKLQMCPTVLYPLTDGLYNVKQVLYKDLKIDSPYNTYENKGLPIGPICSPGQASIEAALYPEASEYLFYHVDDEKKGSHIFSKTYQEHEDSRIKK